MSKIFSKYEGNLDRAWYSSSNVFYSECIDNEGELKTVKVVFSNGRTYTYKDVNVNDYLLFREAESQGRSLNTLLKKYDCERVDDSDMDSIQSELVRLSETSEEDYSVVFVGNEKLEVLNGTSVVYTANILDETKSVKLDDLKEILTILKVKMNERD